MPTVGERLATLETTVREVARRLEAVEDSLNGGGDVEYTRSVRGRLHSVEGTLAAMGVVTKQRVRILKGWHAAAITLAALVTATSAVVSALHVIFGG